MTTTPVRPDAPAATGTGPAATPRVPAGAVVGARPPGPGAGALTSVLVANRGEVAVRIIRTARELGLRTVAVHSDADRGAPHVRDAHEAHRLGPAPAAQSYLRTDAVLDALRASGADAVHPGYGFLSEDAGFARAVEAAGAVFVGPAPTHLERFGTKHTARALASAAGVPLVAGTDLLDDVDQALAAATGLGYPVMLKATGGGGGIGLRVCRTPDDLVSAFTSVRRQAETGFASTGVFLERYVEHARHLEVQVFGDGTGRVLVLGDRDCTLQRRHQKVVEEAPAPHLPPALRERLHTAAHDLAASVGYRSAGTVEFVYDQDRAEASFLEVNTRLQVEHPVTELVHGVDLVAWMLRLAGGDTTMFDAPVPAPAGVAVEARVYAEDPVHDHRPGAGTLTRVHWPADVRVDTWVGTGTEVSAHYDPMLAKVVAHGPDRPAALAALAEALDSARVDGLETNLPLLRAAVRDPRLAAATHTTATLADVPVTGPRLEVLRAGTLTTVQDLPGRTGMWEVGVPPSGPMDDLSFRLGNLALGNDPGAPGLECTLQGVRLRTAEPLTVCVTGADVPVTVDDAPVPCWQPVHVPAGGVLDLGTPATGLRSYLLVAGGLDVPHHLGSASTFTLGRFGGHAGRALRVGDVLRPRPVPQGTTPPDGAGPVPAHLRPHITGTWTLAVHEGPHAAPEFFTPDDVETICGTDWKVNFNSSRTGVRLDGPKPRWARTDGGEAGLHPSNIHDTPYSVGALDLTGDTPILLGPDGPSLGGFVCPVTVVVGERWKLGQLRPGDTVRFARVDAAEARARRARPTAVAATAAAPPYRRDACDRGPDDQGVLARREAGDGTPAVTYRRSGDDNVLVEYGPMTLDLGLRLRVHALAERVRAEALPGVRDITPGIRSLQVHVDPDVTGTDHVLGLLREIEPHLPATGDLAVPSRTVHLPLSWDDPATREAIARYMAGVRADAPWCPWNIEFIRRVNGLDGVDDVHRTVFDAEYLVLGLGDVYLGAPVATPLDPRHRLVTTKYNPARTWTPENAVGIGGAYLCIYGMEGPGGYQFVGRTTQVWARHPQGAPFDDGSPWLLRHFDRIRWYPVGAEELLDLRADVAAGRAPLQVEPGTFTMAGHERFLAANASSIAEFKARQAAAFGAERDAWAAAGEFDPRPDPVAPAPAGAVDVPAGHVLVEAPMTATVWRVDTAPGAEVRPDRPLVVLEAMKMEMPVTAGHHGVVTRVLVAPGDEVHPGTPLAVVRTATGTAPAGAATTAQVAR